MMGLFTPGSDRIERANVKIISASTLSLKKLKEKLCQPFYYRISKLKISIPPLRERKIEKYIYYFLLKECEEQRKELELSESAMDFLRSFKWEGNLRELQSMIHSLVLMKEGMAEKENEFNRLFNVRSDIIYFYLDKNLKIIDLLLFSNKKEELKKMDKKYTWKFLKILLVIIYLLFSIRCEQRKRKEEPIYFKAKSNMFQKWDDIFPEHEVINSNFPPAYYFLTMNSQENYFLYSRKDEKIVQFNRNWNFVREISRKGEGPGEFQIPWPVFFDLKDNFYIYDIGKRSINIFSYPDYRFYRQIRLKSHVSKIIFDSDNQKNPEV